MKRTAMLLIVLVLIAFLAPAGTSTGRTQAQGAQQMREFSDAQRGIYLRTLPNGMRVVIRENHTAPVVSCHAIVHTGSIDEGEYLGSGMSHIFEHVMSGGTTTTRTEKENDRLGDLIGASQNAATSKDYTEYYMTVTSRYFPQAVDMLSDYLIRCTFDRAELEREFGVITQELLKGREEPSRVMWQLFDETAYDKHPERYPTIGYLERFLRLNREDVIKYYRRRYVPENIVFAVAGDVDPKQAFKIIAKAFEPFEARPLEKIEFPEEPVKHGRRYAEREANIQNAMIRMGYRTVKGNEPDMYPLDLLAYIAGRGQSSILNGVLAEEKQLVQEIFAYSQTPDYVHGHFIIGCDLQPDKIEQVQKEVAAVMETFKKPLPEELLEAAKKRMLADYIFYLQDVDSQAESLGFAVLQRGDPLEVEHYIERIKKVRAADIVRVAKKYFSEDNLTVAVIKPRTSAEASQLPSLDVEPKQSDVVKFTLANGLTVLLRRNTALPLVSFQTYSRGGVLFEGDKKGVSNLMANLLLRGTAKRSVADIYGEIESVGGRIEFVSGNNTFGLSVDVLKDDIGKGIDILSDCLLNPAFDEKEVDVMKGRIADSVRARNNSWSAEVVDLYRSKFYGDYPYGRNVLGDSAEDVARLTRRDVVDFYNKYVVGGNTVLAVFGDIDVEKTKALIEKAFASMKPGKAVPPALKPAPKLSPGKDVIKYVKPTKRGQVNLVLGTNGVAIGDDDQYAMSVLSIMLGRKLHEALRGRNDYVYLVFANNVPGFGTGTFYIIAQTTPDKYDKMMNEIWVELNALMKGEFSDEDLDSARRGAVSYSEIGMQKNSDVAGAAALDELYGMGYDYYLKYPSKVAKVSREDVLKVAKKYFVRWLLVETRPEGSNG